MATFLIAPTLPPPHEAVLIVGYRHTDEVSPLGVAQSASFRASGLLQRDRWHLFIQYFEVETDKMTFLQQ